MCEAGCPVPASLCFSHDSSLTSCPLCMPSMVSTAQRVTPPKVMWGSMGHFLGVAGKRWSQHDFKPPCSAGLLPCRPHTPALLKDSKGLVPLGDPKRLSRSVHTLSSLLGSLLQPRVNLEAVGL